MVPVGRSSVAINSSTRIIGSGALAGCSRVTSLSLPNGLTTIESGAFSGSGINSITIPRSVTSIGSQSGWSPDVITGYSNSAAETFASSAGYTFNSLDGGSSSDSSDDDTDDDSSSSAGSVSVDLNEDKSSSGSGSSDDDIDEEGAGRHQLI